MEERRFVALSVLLALVWGSTALAWLLHAAKDRARRVSTLVMVGFALAFGPIAFSKNGGDPPLRSGAAAPSAPSVSLLLAEVRTNAVFDLSMPSNAVAHGPWLRRGASDDWFWFHATNDLFRAGTNAVRSVRVSSRGAFAFPDGSRLEPFHAVLGVLPEPNWTNAPSRVWHAPAAGGGRLFTWENAALERNPATPVSFQAELRPDGDLVGRYALSHHATNFVIAAFDETAFSVRGGVTNAATVCRVDGTPVAETPLSEILRDATRFELVWRAAESDLDADPDGDGLTTRDELRRHGTDPRQSDTDGDGLSDASEILLGSNPLDADENGDGIPDGLDSAAWAANPLWATNWIADANAFITLERDVTNGTTASLVVGDLTIPLRTAGTFALRLEPGEAYDYRLFVNGSDAIRLSLADLLPGADTLRSSPSDSKGGLWEEGSGDVFSGPSRGGSGRMARARLELVPAAPSEFDNDGPGWWCVRPGTGAMTFRLVLRPYVISDPAGKAELTHLQRIESNLLECIPGEPGSITVGTAVLRDPGFLRGSISDDVWIHLCDASPQSVCSVCGHGVPVVTLSSDRQLLTLKHDSDLFLDLSVTAPAGDPATGARVEIRRQGDGHPWLELGSGAALSPWTARAAGRFLLRGVATCHGSDYSSSEIELEVQFPSIGQIMSDPAVVVRATNEWALTLSDCTQTPNLRRERGFWISLDTGSNAYVCGPSILGPLVGPDDNASLPLTNRPPDRARQPSSLTVGAVYTVATFHTHTPTTYLVGDDPLVSQVKPVGPSETDFTNAVLRSLPGIAYDFDPQPGCFSANGDSSIPLGWPKTSPASMYEISPPARRPTP